MRKHLLLAFEGGMALVDRKNLFKTRVAGYLGFEELGHPPGGSLSFRRIYVPNWRGKCEP